MVRKTLLALSAAAALFSTSALADAITEKCQSTNEAFDDVVDCVRRQLQSQLKKAKKNPKSLASVYVGTGIIGEDESHERYYDLFNKAYQEAMLDMRVKAITKKGADFVANQAANTTDNTKNEANLKKEAGKEALAKLAEKEKEQSFEDIIRGITKRVKDIVGVKDGETLTAEQKKRIEAEVEKILFSKSFNTSFLKTATGASKGLINRYVLISEDGRQMAVISYQTDRSMQLRSALLGKGYVTPPEDKSTCKTAEDVLDELYDGENVEEVNKKKLSTIGTYFYWDENCQPAILTIAMRGFSQNNKNMIPDLKATNLEEAELFANNNLATFLNTEITSEKNFEESASRVQKIIAKAVNTMAVNPNVSLSEFKNEINSSFSSAVQASTRVDTKGMDEVSTWYVDKGDVGVVGIALNYSVANIKAIDELIKAEEASEQQALNAKQSAQEVEEKAAPKKRKMVIKSNALTDDF